MSRFQKRLILFLFILAILSPAGIILPKVFDAGDAWGEWGLDTINEMLGFIPEGMKRLADLWKAPVPDYSIEGEDASLFIQILSYIISGIAGILLVGGFILIIAKIYHRKTRNLP